MKKNLRLLFLVFLTALSLSCSKKNTEADGVDPLVLIKSKREFENSQPFLEWITKTSFLRNGKEGYVQLKEKDPNDEFDMGVFDIKKNTSTGGLASLSVCAADPCLEFAILESFAYFVDWLKSNVSNLENSAIDEDVSSIAGEKSKTIETVSKSKLRNYDIECKKTVIIRSDEGEEESIKSISLLAQNKFDIKYLQQSKVNLVNNSADINLIKTGDLDLRVFIKDMLEDTVKKSPKYAISICSDPINHQYYARLKITFSDNVPQK